jgi:raffinose/stachyose/melibiose transport system substrate-binding protein
MRVAATSSEGPDIYLMWSGYGLGGEFVNSGTSSGLHKCYDQYKWDDRCMGFTLELAGVAEEERHRQVTEAAHSRA